MLTPCKNCHAAKPVTHADKDLQARYPFECHRKAPKPTVDGSAVLGTPYTYWVYTDGSGCCEGLPKKDEPASEPEQR